jgi:hypothetical protein
MPEQLLGRIITACSNPRETVLDPFGGSGTTLVVAKKLNRRFVGFELSRSYADNILARLERAHVGEALKGSAEQFRAPPTANGKSRKDLPKDVHVSGVIPPSNGHAVPLPSPRPRRRRSRKSQPQAASR